MNASLLGQSQHTLETPHLRIDLDLFESNMESMSRFCQRSGCSWRPHSKAHKSPDIARLQLAAGALGITCAKLSEAEMMVDHGIDSILLANQLTTQEKWLRLADLVQRAEVIVSVEDFDVIDLAEKAAQQRGVSIPIVLELDVGMGRVGLNELAEVLRLAERITASDALIFRGLMGYEGHVLAISPPAEKEAACRSAINVLIRARDALAERNIACEIISAGGTGSYFYTARIDGITEVQAGGGIFMDCKYRDEFHVGGLDIALRAITTVTSKRPGQIVTDAGFKTLSAHHGTPQVLSHSGIELKYLSAEHGVYTVSPDHPIPALGERLELALGYTDSTTFLHDVFYGVRNGIVETIWPILGRGLLT